MLRKATVRLTRPLAARSLTSENRWSGDFIHVSHTDAKVLVLTISLFLFSFQGRIDRVGPTKSAQRSLRRTDARSRQGPRRI